MSNILSVCELCFSYSKKEPVLRGVDLEIKENSVTGILGRNGCGKSTLFDNIIGHSRFSGGKITVGGDDITALSARELSRRAAYVPQNSVVNMDFTVFEFILFGRNCHLPLSGSPSDSDHELVYKYAERCGISKLLEKSVNRVSGGERQLACIARALVQESPLILMDEPASALDYGNQARLLRIIQELQAAGKTIIFTTHDPSFVIRLGCDAAIMADGKITAHGKAREIVTPDRLVEIYGEDVLLFQN